jgi:hypothetical protein
MFNEFGDQCPQQKFKLNNAKLSSITYKILIFQIKKKKTLSFSVLGIQLFPLILRCLWYGSNEKGPVSPATIHR